MCLPCEYLCGHQYLRRQTLRIGCVCLRRKALVVADKLAGAVELIPPLGAFPQTPVLVVADRHIGDKGRFEPLSCRLLPGRACPLFSSPRVNAELGTVS